MDNYFKSSDDKDIFFHEWLVENPKGTVQIVHGMMEHGKRYKYFARFLNERGYSVFASDHRGHGLSKNDHELLGDIGINGFEMMVEDEIIFANKIKNKYNKPHFVIGQSMGSFICQRMIQKRKNLSNGYIMLGSTCCIEKIAKVGKVVARILMTLFGVKVSNLMDKLVFLGYNKKTEKRTSFDWLNRDHKEIDKYINDSSCGFISPNRFYYYLLDSLTKLWKPENMEKISKNENILILSGDADPVSEYGEKSEELYKLYEKYGIEKINFKLYPDSRHELLNEENKYDVYEDIFKWLEENL